MLAACADRESEEERRRCQGEDDLRSRPPPPVEGELGRDRKFTDCGHMLSEPGRTTALCPSP